MVLKVLHSGWAGFAAPSIKIENGEGQGALEAGKPINCERCIEWTLNNIRCIDKLTEIKLLAYFASKYIILCCKICIIVL
jgi:hypothetical protein